MKSFERQNTKEVWSTAAAFKAETTILEQFRKKSNRTVSALALAFAALSSEGCGLMQWHGIDPIHNMRISNYEKASHKMLQKDDTTLELTENGKIAYTLTMPQLGKVMLRGDRVTAIKDVHPSRWSDCATGVKVFGVKIRVDFHGGRIFPEDFPKWDPDANPLELFDECR